MKIKYLIPLLFLVACTGNQQAQEKPAPLYPQPQTVELNTDEGYKFNTVTGDTIQPIILGNGDTLITGVPIFVTGKTIHPNSVSQPKVVPIIQPDSSYNAHPNVHLVPDDLTVIPVNHDLLTTILLEEIPKGDTTHYLINSIGDTIPTGVPIPTTGKVMPFVQPQSTKALAPRFKDAVINNMQYLDVDQGMASSVITSILEDKNGNIWFGTDGSGVSMYNGISFTNFTEKEGLSSNIVRSILEDKNGNIWFGTYGGGVSMYNGKFFTNFTEQEGLSNNVVYSILEDKSGNIWFGTVGGGVSVYNGKFFTHFTEKEGLSNNIVMSILEDKNGDIWLGTQAGVSIYNGKSFTHLTEKEGLSNNAVYSILEDKNGNIWFSTFGNGVSMYNGKSFTHFTEKEGLSSNTILSLLEDKSGNIWFGTAGGGVSTYNGNFFTHFTEKEGLSGNIVMSILEDKSGNIWFGTYGGGVSMYNRKPFIHFTEKEGLSNNDVLSILEDRNGNLWFGTYVGISMYNGKYFTHFTEKEGLSNNAVYSILEDKNGNIWFGTYGGGVSMYNGKSFTHFTEKEGLSSNNIISILEDKKGNLWFGNNGVGVSMYNGKSFIHFTEKEGFNGNSITSILEDKSGNIWFSTYGRGVIMYNGEFFTHFTEKEGLSGNIVMSSLADKSGNIWFGTNGGGVSMYNGKSFTYFTEKEGLSSNIVMSILESENGNIWLSTAKGLNELVLSEEDGRPLQNRIGDNKNSYFIKRYVKNDGLKGMGFSSSSAYLDSKNRMWWGNDKGLTMLDLNKHATATQPPTVFLKQLDINEQFIDYRFSKSLNEANEKRETSDATGLINTVLKGVSYEEVPAFYNYPLNLELPYNKNHLTFHFVAIDWSAPHKIQYSYIMEGSNTAWSTPSHKANADYRNLPYGKYTFKIRAIGESGEWSEAFEYEFTIHPPWWHTMWFRILVGLCFILVLYLLFRWRIAKLKQRQKELETEVENATQEIREQKEHVEEVHKEITDSINYAERIQRSFLATKELLDENLKEYFVFFKPKDVVSGDFYWADKLSNGNFVMVNADSTGHGVPGAIMSILNISSIEKAIDSGLQEPAEIFNSTRKTIIERLKKDGSKHGGKDGMDASIICFDFANMKFTYATAQNPIWVVRDRNLIQLKPEKMPIGKHDNDHIPFESTAFDLQKGDQVYTLTDGFQDQFGGVKGKKFMVKKMREYILSISHLPMAEQHIKITEVFTDWKGNLEQVDDVCVIGVKIG